MSTTVTYKGSVLTTVINQTKKLLTSGKYMEDDVTITDSSSGTCEDIIQVQEGFLVLDEDCPASGNVYQDEDGFIVLDSNDFSGLEYEEGTWSPSEDVENVDIYFLNAHASPPIFAMISDSAADVPNLSYYAADLLNWYGYTGVAPAGVLGLYGRQYTNSSGIPTGSSGLFNNGSSMGVYVTNERYSPVGATSGYYFRSGRTYKWIAVWGK